MTPANSPTVVVELTPVGRGAMAVVLVAGPKALPAVAGLFHSVRGISLAEAPVDKIVLGRWGGPDGEELIACRRAEEEIEIHCHGGIAAVRSVMDALVERGGRQTTWQEWVRQAAIDPIRAAAQIALASAPTARTAAILLDQFDGALSQAIRLALAEVAVERWQAAAQVINVVLTFRDVGLHLTSPWQVVLAGRTNVGKSSLLNALAGYQRAIVSPLAGTTRDVLTVRTAIDGWPVQLMDTAGVRETDDALEAAGAELAGKAVDAADLVLIVHDGTDFSLPIPPRARRIYVENKIDLASPSGFALDLELMDNDLVTLTSALTGEGIAELVTAIGQALVPSAPTAGAAVPFTAEQIAALQRARAAIDDSNGSAALPALQSLLAH